MMMRMMMMMMMHFPFSSTRMDNHQVSQTKRWTSNSWCSCACLPIALPSNFNGPGVWLLEHRSNIGFKFSAFSLPKNSQMRRDGWRRAFALDTGGISGNGGGQQESLSGDSPGLGGTRLGRIVSAGGRQLLEKLNSARKNFPMKLFLLLLGFYTANALATILGQTGDWDVLVAGVVVAAIEGIGMLMYRKPLSPPTGRLQSFVVMVNYWKAGMCLGLFVDAFKLGHKLYTSVCAQRLRGRVCVCVCGREDGINSGFRWRPGLINGWNCICLFFKEQQKSGITRP